MKVYFQRSLFLMNSQMDIQNYLMKVRLVMKPLRSTCDELLTLRDLLDFSKEELRDSSSSFLFF